MNHNPRKNILEILETPWNMTVVTVRPDGTPEKSTQNERQRHA